MEFNEKLQQLRKQQALTQEQLAEKLFVSRTAISKWESGKGYPSIESLKAISKFFSISIDELLSSDELLHLAEKENQSNIKKVYGLVYGVIDLLAILFIILPMYGQTVGGYIYSVNLFRFKETTRVNLVIYWAIFSILILCGILELIFLRMNWEKQRSFVAEFAIRFDVFAICFFACAREPYVNLFLFLMVVIKILIDRDRNVMKIS